MSVFSSNRAVPLNICKYTSSYDRNESLGFNVFASKSGSLLFSSDLFEFELENSLDHQSVNSVFISESYGIVITLSDEMVQIWDCFRMIEGKRVSMVNRAVTPSNPKSLYLFKPTNTCYIGFENGKVQVMDISACADQLPLPKFASVPFCDVRASVTCINAYQKSFMMFGTSEGFVKMMKLDTKKLVWTVKAPQSHIEVRSLCPVVSTTAGESVQVIICYNAPVVALVSDGAILHVVKDLVEPVRYAFSASVADSSESPLILSLGDNKLVRLDGPRWSHSSVIADECLSLKPDEKDSATYISLERHGETGSVEMKRTRVTTGLGPLDPQPSISTGCLSLSAVGNRTPVHSVGLARSDRSLEPNLIRLCNSLTFYPQSSTKRFVFDFNAGLWEGVIFSVFNGPCELAISIFTHNCVRVLSRVAIKAPHLAIVTSMAVDCVAQDRWSVLLGFSSGQVGIMESAIDYPAPTIRWKELWLLEAPDQVHSGAKIVHVDRSLFGMNLVTSVDVNGMICFTRVDESVHAAVLSKSLTLAHVAIGGEGGNAFPDSSKNCVYVAVAGGGIERIKTPKLRKDGSEEAHDAEVWSATTVVDYVPLSGRSVKLFPDEGFGVYSDGIAIITFPSKSGSGKLGTVANSEEEILHAEIFIHENISYLVTLTAENVIAYDYKARVVFRRGHREDGRITVGSLLKGTGHLFKWAESLASIAFSDRTKILSAPELVIRSAQDRFKFPSIKSTPFAEQLAPVVSGSSETSSASGKDKKTRALEEKYKPTAEHLAAARAQLHKNMDAMARLQDRAAEMEESSADFLTLANKLAEKEQRKSKKKFFGLF